MVARVFVRTLGGLQVRQNGVPVDFPTRHAAFLFAYLATEPDAIQTRGKLAALLWGDRGEEQARGSLRQTRYRIRRLFPELAPGPLIAESQSVAIDRSVVQTDVDILEAGGDDGLAVLGGEFLDGWDGHSVPLSERSAESDLQLIECLRDPFADICHRGPDLRRGLPQKASVARLFRAAPPACRPGGGVGRTRSCQQGKVPSMQNLLPAGDPRDAQLSSAPLLRPLLIGLAAAWLALAHPGAACAQERLQPDDFHYLGAFRLPDAGNRPLTFAWGGNAMTYRPAGGRQPEQGELPGSLFVMGHDRIAYGEVPDGNQVAEISIPRPVVADSPGDLPVARLLQPFAEIAAGQFAGLDELPRVGMEYLDAPETGPLIHLAWGQHFQPDPDVPSHAWIRPDLSDPDFTGTWFIGSQSGYSTNGYLFEIPRAWADAHVGGRVLATGRFRDGGWSGMGPALFAYRPWTDAAGSPAEPGAHLDEIPLLLYRNSNETEAIEGALAGYQHPDEWEGGAWIETTSGRTAVIFAGTKAIGDRYWYGFANPRGPEYPCVAGQFVGQYPVCRLADGSECPPEDLAECSGHNDYRGWWSTGYEAQIIFYDPADLAEVAAGHMEPWQPQPYASLALDNVLFFDLANIDPDMLGAGVQRHYRIGSVAYDRIGNLLFVLELFADEDKPVVHVWQLG
jgi:hypothetical protein